MNMESAAAKMSARGGRWGSIWFGLLIGLVSALSYFDRSLVYVLTEVIKKDLDLSDAQIGLLTGLMFSAPFCAAALAGGMLSDRFGRVKLLAGAILIWSIMTSTAGFAKNFMTLGLTRAGVGMAEAVGVPASHALAGDRFTKRVRGTAFGFITFMAVVGEVAALSLGGYLNEALGWRATFMVAGAPGLIIALLVWLTIREVRTPRQEQVAAPNYGAAFRVLWKRRAFVYLTLGFTLIMFANYAFFSFLPAMLIRRFGLTTAEVGVQIGSIIGVSVLLGTAAGGPLADWLRRRDVRYPYYMTVICFILIFPLRLLISTLPSLDFLPLLLFFMYVLNGLWYGPLFGAIQDLAGPQFRATATAIALSASTLLGAGVGPWVTGEISDALNTAQVPNALGLAVCMATVVVLPAAWCFWRASRSLEADIADADAFSLDTRE